MLFQPTNITPSLSGGLGNGVVDLYNKSLNVSWQVNGNSPMTKFQIDIFENDASSTVVYSTGVLTDNCPFYGTDYAGNVNLFTYTITTGQMYTKKAVSYASASITNVAVVFSTFDTAVSSATGTYTFTYNGSSWKLSGNIVSLATYGITVYGEADAGDIITVKYGTATPIYFNGDEYKMIITQYYGVNEFVRQSSASVFVTRYTPSLSINTITTPVTTRTLMVGATYSQFEGDALNFVRWKFAIKENGAYTILDDTGNIYGTAQLQYNCDGLFSGSTYAVKCIVQTEYGVMAETEWKDFLVQYSSGEITGSLNLSCSSKYNGIVVKLPFSTGVVGLTGFDIYRLASDESILKHVCEVGLNQYQVVDLYPVSNKTYTYYAFGIFGTQYSNSYITSDPVTPYFWDWTLYSCKRDNNGMYQPEATYVFSSNISVGAMSNNNTPSVLNNFTKYPLVQQAPFNYKSGTLTGLIGAVQDGQYVDTISLRNAIYNLSTTSNDLFLKDRKGEMIRIRLNGAITMSTSNNSANQAQTMSLPWVEVGAVEDERVVVQSSAQSCLSFAAMTANSSVTLTSVGSPSWSGEYSIDGIEWYPYVPNTTGTIRLNSIGDRVYFVGDMNGGTSASSYLHFTMTGTIAASGNVNSMYVSEGFDELTALTQTYCYTKMFQNCTSLVIAPSLSSTTVSANCYDSMFAGCTSLTHLPTLPATTLASSCYANMFAGCTSITAIPTLSATTMAESCYSGMFSGCTGINTRPYLPATTLAASCYASMFANCTGLTAAPSLPVTTLATSCYSGMFSGCTGLTTAPSLPSTVLVDSCYANMFKGCSNINTMNVGFTEWSPSSATTSWVQGVAATGYFYADTSLPQVFDVSHVPSGWTVDLPPNPLAFTANTSGSTIELTAEGDAPWTGEYSTDGSIWVTYVPNTTGVITLSNIGDKVYFRGNITGDFSGDEYLAFEMSGSIAASGNINSMYVSNGYGNLTTLTYKYCYLGLFFACDSLTSAPEMPATTLSEGCYMVTFAGCTSLTTAPTLSATTLTDECYYCMFMECTSLTSMPSLQASTLAAYCYCYMFGHCTSLTTVTALPATTLYEGCYMGMFEGCESLTASPSISATTLAESCYSSMFYGCESLTTAPALPATTLAEDCYYGMFSECTALETAPKLQATTLATNCYKGMFDGCDSLTTIPELPATTLYEGCYEEMFNGCDSLEISDAQTQTATVAWTVPSSGTFTNTYAQSDMFYGCAGTRASNDMAGEQGQSYTYYTQNNPISDIPDYLCFTANTAGSTIRMSLTEDETPTLTVGFEYSTDRVTWNTFTVGSTTITLVNVGDKVYFRGDNPNGISESEDVYYKFIMTGSVAASGNIMSLVDKTCQSLTIPNSYCYFALFYGCSSLTAAPKLPATILTTNCYDSMFNGCSSLTTAPALPATVLVDYCYYSMFADCELLTTAPALRATTLATHCYYNMFSGCESLYVSDAPVIGVCEQAWRIPISGTFISATAPQGYMFEYCLGTRESDDMAGAQGQFYTYYTQNTPV